MKKLIATLAMICSLGANANQNEAPIEEPSNFVISGFVSQAIVKTTNNVRVNGDTEKRFGSLDRTEFGVFASKEINQYIDTRGMVSYIGDGGPDNRPRVVYGLFDIHTASGMHGVRIGRYNYGYGFYSYASNNPLYQDMEIPPQALYKEGFRYMMRGDGIQLYTKKHISEDLSAEFEFGYGEPLLFPKSDVNQIILLRKDAGEFTDKSRLISMNSTFNIRPYGIVIKYDYLVLDYSFSTRMIDKGSEFPIRPRNSYLGVRKYFEFGDLTLEYALVKTGRSKYSDALSLPGYEWNGSVGTNITYKHYLTDNISLILGYDTWHSNRSDRHGEKIETISGGRVPRESRYSKSINIGVSYRTNKYTIRAEAHRVIGTNALRATENDILNKNTAGMYDIYMISASYKF